MRATAHAAWHLKGAWFQSFVIQAKAVSFPLQQLEMSLPFIEENKNIAQLYGHIQFVGYQPAQPVKTFSHVGSFMVQQVPGGMVCL